MRVERCKLHGCQGLILDAGRGRSMHLSDEEAADLERLLHIENDDHYREFVERQIARTA